MNDQAELQQRIAAVDKEIENRVGSDVKRAMVDALSRTPLSGDNETLMRMISSPRAVDHFIGVGREAIAAENSEEADRAWAELRRKEREQHRLLHPRFGK